MPGTTPNQNLPYPVPGDTVDVPRDVKALADALDPLGFVPIGAITMWPTNAAPSRWLLCNGQQVSAATYPGLAAVLGQAGGLVTLPDYTDRFPSGPGANNGATALTRGPAGFANNGLDARQVAITVAQMPSHDHFGQVGDDTPDHTHGMGFASVRNDAAQTNVAFGTGSAYTTTGASNRHRHAITAQGGGGAHENRPPYLTVNFIIRAL